MTKTKGKRLSRPLYEGGERCRLRKFLLVEATIVSNAPIWPPKAVPTDCSCTRDPHDDPVHECACGARWVA